MYMEMTEDQARDIYEFTRTNIGQMLLQVIEDLETGFSERLVSEKFPDFYVTQGKVQGIRHVQQMFEHAKRVVQGDAETAGDQPTQTNLEIPSSTYPTPSTVDDSPLAGGD